MTEEIEKLKTDIDNSNEINSYTMDRDIIENQSGKIINLINNENSGFNYILQSKYYNFKLKEPIYIQKIKFLSEIDLKNMELISVDFTNNESTVVFKKGNSAWVPNKVMKEFKIKAPKKYFSDKVKLNKIEIIGFKIDDFNSLKDKVLEIENFKSNLTELSNKIEQENNTLNQRISETDTIINEKNSEVDKLNSDIHSLNDTLSPLKEEKETLINNINELISKKELLIQDNTNLDNNTKQLDETSKQLNSKISNQKDELQKLTEDTNIFATEMKEYIEQGNNDITLYTKLSLIPWIIIAIVSGIVFWGSSDLSTIYNPLSDIGKNRIDMSAIFWSRLPFVMIVISILFVSYEVSKIFIKNIIHIQKQKRIFTKIGIIAKDVADSSIKGLEISDEEKFQLRTKLKIDLLKNHLTKEIGENYEYKIKASLWEHFIEYISKNKENSKKESQ